MTIEEIINIIKKYDIKGCGYCHQGGDEVEEAFNVIIKILEQLKDMPEYIDLECPNHSEETAIDVDMLRTIKLHETEGTNASEKEAIIRQTSVFDKIKVELYGMYRVILKDVLQNDWAIGWNDCLDNVLKIIDEYKKESEKEE